MIDKMITAETIRRLLRKHEGLHLEMKECRDKLPRSVWETYSAFANTRGGVILLGVTEHKDRPLEERYELTGVADSYKVITDFFNIVNNRQKVSRSVMVDSDIRPVEINGVEIVYINVPEADYRQKPIYINNNLQSGTFKRMHEGDRHVSDEELAMLIRDSSDTADARILQGFTMECVDVETLRGYRQSFNNRNPNHVFESLSDRDFLLNLGAYAKDYKDGVEGLTVAGLLMFGKSLPLHQAFPNFRVDYLDLRGIEPGGSKKWNDRLTDDGRWVDNIYNFLTIALNKLLFTLPSEGRLKGVVRIDGGELYEAVREGFINCLTYCDYALGGVLRIDRRTDSIVMRNPGVLRIPPERIYGGDYTQARNSTIQKMLRMIGLGDNIGSGFRKILHAWKELGYEHPSIKEEQDINEVWLTLPLVQVYESVTDKPAAVTEPTVNVTDKPAAVTEPTVNSTMYVTDGVRNVTDSGRNVTDNGPDIPDNDSERTNGKEGPTKRRGVILDRMRKDPSLTLEKLADQLGVTRRTISRDIESLTKMKLLRRDGGDFGGKWIVI